MGRNISNNFGGFCYNKMKIYVVVPAFNEEKKIVGVIKELRDKKNFSDRKFSPGLS